MLKTGDTPGWTADVL